MKENYTQNYSNLRLLTKIIGANVIPSTIPTTTENQYIIGFMEQIRKWRVVKSIQRVKAGAFWDTLDVTIDNKTINGMAAYKKLFDYQEDIDLLLSQDLNITNTENVWKISFKSAPNNYWIVDTKLVMNDEEMIKVATLIYDSKIPFGKTVQLQADSHIAGKYTWVGMIASYDNNVIPFSTVSADIGCGISILPFVKNGIHKSASTDADDLEILKYDFMLKTRAALYRGKRAETGDNSMTIQMLNQALLFFGSQINVAEFTDNLKYMFDTLEIDTNGVAPLDYAAKFAQ